MATPVSPARVESVAPTSASATDRRYELDWLRVFIVLGLIPFHAVVYFGPSNNQASVALGLLNAFAGIWGMPVLFVVAGAGSYFALNRRTAARYLWERVQRLAIPFVFATLTIIPLQAYPMLLNNPTLVKSLGVPMQDPNFLSSPLTFYLEYLRASWYFLTHFNLTLTIVYWGHLWFVPLLFAYALVSLPLFLWLKSVSGKRLLVALGRVIRIPGAIFLFAIPLTLVDLYVKGMAFTVFYLVYFLYGYLAFAISTMPGAVARQGGVALTLGAAGAALALWITQAGVTNDLTGALIMGFVGWFWVVTILSFAFHRLSFTNAALAYLNEAAFPVYILHMPVLTFVGLAFTHLTLPWALSLVLIIAATLALTIGLYELVVRRFRIMRALFGLKLRPRRTEMATFQPPATPPNARATPLTTG